MEAETPGGADAPKPKDTKDKSVDEQIQDALEAMLSKKSLVKDQFLASKMNPQMYIPISVLLQHDRLQSLRATQMQVAAAAAKSKRLGVDDQRTMVRPVFKSKRHIVILRDLPDGTTEEEILSLFSTGPYAENVVSVKPEVNNTWFVKFVDEVAPEVVLWLRSQTFKGKPVNAAIKSEHFLRSFFPVNQSMGFVPPGLPPMDEGDVHPMHGFPPAPFPGGKGAGCPDFMPPPGMMPPMQMGMPYEMPVEPNMQFGLQSPGFWKPWGSRHRQPPLTFSPDCPRIGNDQVAPQMESWGTGAPSKGKSKGKEDFSKGKSKKGKGTSGKWSIDWEDSAPPGYKGIKGKPSWYDESEDVAQVVPLDDRIRKASDVKAPKMKWAVKSGGESG
ncbi:unnamed protein product [Durusdinium trenchii]|uniref:HTH La-type RNA-binding domain-containing protein n=1 Tax=Durusdinium trenchii TaxID=1381693 RepID=A0ABP0QMR5_9DINO